MSGSPLVLPEKYRENRKEGVQVLRVTAAGRGCGPEGLGCPTFF